MENCHLNNVTNLTIKKNLKNCYFFNKIAIGNFPEGQPLTCISRSSSCLYYSHCAGHNRWPPELDPLGGSGQSWERNSLGLGHWPHDGWRCLGQQIYWSGRNIYWSGRCWDLDNLADNWRVDGNLRKLLKLEFFHNCVINVSVECRADPPENCHLNVKTSQKLALFLKLPIAIFCKKYQVFGKF